MANTIERIGVYHCAEIAACNKWIFREQPVDDIGIDAHMEFVDESGKNRGGGGGGVKTGSSWFRDKKDDYIVFRDINVRQYNYWTTNSLPCIVVLYNPDDGMCIWQELTDKTIERTKGGSGKGFFVKVPTDQVFLNYLSNKKLLSFTNLPKHVLNYNFLLSQKKFIQIIKDGGIVKLHSIEWVNKSSGRGETELIVDDGENEKRYVYPYYFPFTPYTEVFPKLFPWANFEADEDFYDEEDKSLWHEYHCYYDKEDEEWLIVGDSFEEFRKKLNPMRSINHSGEVAEYMLTLSINELGRSFLTIDDYISQDQPYTKVVPEEQ